MHFLGEEQNLSVLQDSWLPRLEGSWKNFELCRKIHYICIYEYHLSAWRTLPRWGGPRQISAPHPVSEPMARQLLVCWACPQGRFLNPHRAWVKEYSCLRNLLPSHSDGSMPWVAVCNVGKKKKRKQKVSCDLSSSKIVLAPTKLSKLKKAELILLMPFFQSCCPATLTEMEAVALLLKLVTLLIWNEAFYWINHCSIKYCWAIIYIHPLHPEWFCR